MMSMKIAVCGCTHGFLDMIYHAIEKHDAQDKQQTQLLLCCGDFQAVRNKKDLDTLSCPPKYRRVGDFVHYANGSKVAPVLTIFIGGNHEVVELAEHLRYGGWVAPNIFYMGHSNIIRVGPPEAKLENTIRVAGLSGIYKAYDYYSGYHEQPPYSLSSLKSFCHVRSQDLERLQMTRQPLDIFLSHDWPRGIEKHGDYHQLMSRKPFLKSDILNNSLGNPHTYALMRTLKPRLWFAAHLHTKFNATVDHGTTTTRFVALDKPYPGQRQFVDFFQVFPQASISPFCPHSSDSSNLADDSNTCETFQPVLYYDTEWLSILSENKDKIFVGREKIFPFSSHVNLSYPSEECFERVTKALCCKIQPPHDTKMFMWRPLSQVQTLQDQRQCLLNILGASYDILHERLLHYQQNCEEKKDYATHLVGQGDSKLPVTFVTPQSSSQKDSCQAEIQDLKSLVSFTTDNTHEEEMSIDCFNLLT